MRASPGFVAAVGSAVRGRGVAGGAQQPALVLVVDDEEMIRELITTMLGRAGYDVITAATASEAISQVEQWEVSLVLTDINMPGSMTGLELIEELRALRPGLPIVLVTGAEGAANLREALARGAAGFVSKPFTPDDLCGVVELALGRSRLVEGDLRGRLLAPTIASVLANAIELRDPSMEGHTERLARLALAIGRRAGLGEADLEVLELGAVLHDVGKIGVADSILLKPAALTGAERATMQAHVEAGDRMLGSVDLLEFVRPIVRSHHERWDGTGYPDGLAGEEIPLSARIVSIADSVEAMSGRRPYRVSLRRDEVVRELEAGAGRQWDPRLSRIVLDLIAEGRLDFNADGLTLDERR